MSQAPQRLNATVSLRAELSELQAEKLQEQLAGAGLDVTYREEQHGRVLIVDVRCSRDQESAVRCLLSEIGGQSFAEGS